MIRPIPYSAQNVDPAVTDVLGVRGVTELLHFSTNKGLCGVLATRACKSRPLLTDSEYLEYLYTPNCRQRHETAEWLPFVNLSIENINASFFDISSGTWHAGEDLWWCVLAFDPIVAAHDGVYFATTNNRYTGVHRAPGAAGLEALFAEQVTAVARQHFEEVHHERQLHDLPAG